MEKKLINFTVTASEHGNGGMVREELSSDDDRFTISGSDHDGWMLKDWVVDQKYHCYTKIEAIGIASSLDHADRNPWVFG